MQHGTILQQAAGHARVISEGSQLRVMGFQSRGIWLAVSRMVGMSALTCAPADCVSHQTTLKQPA